MKRVRTTKVIIALICLMLLVLFACDNEQEESFTEITITSPASEAIVDHMVRITAAVLDSVNVTQVEFYLDGDSLATITDRPYVIDWNTEIVLNGTHKIYCKAYDISGNVAKSDEIRVTVKNFLFSARFTDNWVETYSNLGVIYVSDMEGNLLKEALFHGDEKFELAQTPSMGALPDRISVTVLYYGYSMPEAITYFDIPRGSYWTFNSEKRYSFGNQYQVEFSFSNEPEHNGFLISNKWTGYCGLGGTGLIESYTLSFRALPARCFISYLSGESGASYLWVNDITEDHYDVDLTSLEMMTPAKIELGEVLHECRLSLFGFSDPGNHYTEDYWLNLDYSSTTGIDSVTVYYLPDEFSDYHTEIWSYHDWFSEKWVQETYGDIPVTFSRIDADFTITSSTIDDFAIETTGSCDVIKSDWYDYENSNYWDCYSPSDITQYALPEPGPVALQRFPDLEMDNYELRNVTLIEHSQLSSYEEMIEIQFNSSDLFFNIVNDIRTRIKYTDEYRNRQIEEGIDPHKQRERYYDQVRERLRD
ncbi:MAG: hypothetical protein K9N06_01080 [Candidatus Cloacimonetes bacterium]|nr:hypothetical protein [Candidatus Cloacimonadota bacterium]